MTTAAVTQDSADNRAEDFDGFYTAHFGDTVAMAYRLTADPHEAQDIAQEAFCRAWQRWPRLSGYDNPGAWVRRVAVHLAYSRWRHARAALAHLLRQRLETAPPPDPDHVAVVAALRKLPAAQRDAIVLHHMLDLPLGEVAHQLDVPVGTVKSWLHRGRQALAGDLAGHHPGHRPVATPFAPTAAPTAAPIAAPTAAQIRARVRRRRTRAAAVAVAVLLFGVAVGVWLLRPPQPPVINPAPTPTTPQTISVTLQRTGDRVIVRWTDPSGGRAQPIIVGAREGEGMRRFAVPARGATEEHLPGLNKNFGYCFQVLLAYTDEDVRESGNVCTDRD